MAYRVPDSEGLQVVPSVYDQKQAIPNVYEQKQVVYTEAPEPVQSSDVKKNPYDTHNGVSYDHDLPQPPKPQRKICGLRPRWFWTVLLVLLVVIAGAVGGGVGGSLASKKSTNSTSLSSTTASSSPSPTTTGTSTSASTGTRTSTTSSSSSSTSSTPLPTTGVLAIDCPALNQTTYTSTPNSKSYTFTRYCDRELYDANQIAAIKAYSLNSCIDSCAKYNDANANLGSYACQGLTWSANLTLFSDYNCFLKTNVTTLQHYYGPGPEVQAAAVLKS